MHATVRNLADAGDEPALHGERIVYGVAGRKRGGAGAMGGRGSGPAARAMAPSAPRPGGCRSGRRGRAPPREHQARSDCDRARPASSCERARWALSNATERAALAQSRAAGERPERAASDWRRSSALRATSARSVAVRRRISGMVAASSERTWTASRTEPGWTRARAAGRRVIVCKAAVSRITGPCRSARRARCSACSAAISAMRRSAAVRSASAASSRAASASDAARARSASLTARRASSSSCR